MVDLLLQMVELLLNISSFVHVMSCEFMFGASLGVPFTNRRFTRTGIWDRSGRDLPDQSEKYKRGEKKSLKHHHFRRKLAIDERVQRSQVIVRGYRPAIGIE